MICIQKDRFLWWLSVGDCVLYLLHPELAHLGQYTLNQRSFYEWIGQINTFDLPVPCYATGVRELRRGRNHVVMTTDGLLEPDASPFADPGYLYQHFTGGNRRTSDATQTVVQEALELVHKARGRDSATVIYWEHENAVPGVYPTG